jgi:hypothetical protein
MSDIQELKETIQQLRKEKYPEIPVALINEILMIEADLLEDKTQALRRVAEAVEKHIVKKVGKET